MFNISDSIHIGSFNGIVLKRSVINKCQNSIFSALNYQLFSISLACNDQAKGQSPSQSTIISIVHFFSEFFMKMF